METINANMFIVPNHMREFLPTNPGDEISLSSHNIKVEKFNMGNEYRLEYGDTGIEIWVTGAGSDNWSDHGVPEELGDGHFVTYLPTHVLMHLNEGDELILQINGHEVVLTANQLNYRYRNFGTFGEALRAAIGY